MDPELEAILNLRDEEIPNGLRYESNGEKRLASEQMAWKKLGVIASTLYGKAYRYEKIKGSKRAQEDNSASSSSSVPSSVAASASASTSIFAVQKRKSIMDKFKDLFRKRKEDAIASRPAGDGMEVENAEMGAEVAMSSAGAMEEDEEVESTYLVLVKRCNKDRVRARVTTDGKRVPEDPVMEYKVLRYLEEQHPHPFIMRIEAFFQDDFDFFTVATYYNAGDLIGYLAARKRPVLGEYEGSLVMRDIVSAVEHIHNLGIVHLDISPENIILHNFPNGEMHAVLIDFGTTRCFPVGDDRSMFEMQVGKEKYMAPEMFRARNKVLRTYPCDVWTIGSTLFTMLCGFNIYSFPTATRCEHFRTIFHQGLKTYAISRDRHLSEKAIDFCVACLQIDPEARLRSRDLMNHPFLRIRPEEDHYSVQL